MSWSYPDPSDNGQLVNAFHTTGKWALDGDGGISAERLALGCAMGVKLLGNAEIHRVACAIIYNNRAYFGYSNHGLDKEDFPDRLLEAMRKRSAESHSVSNCAEIHALTAVVSAGYDPNSMGSGLQVYSCNTSDGEPKPCCNNCIMLLGLANCSSG